MTMGDQLAYFEKYNLSKLNNPALFAPQEVRGRLLFCEHTMRECLIVFYKPFHSAFGLSFGDVFSFVKLLFSLR